MADKSQPTPVGIVVRVAVAAAYGVVVLAAVIFGGTFGVAALYAVIGTVAVVEFYEITRREHRTPNEIFGAVAVAAMPVAAALADLKGLATVTAALVVAALLWHLTFRQVRTTDTATTLFGAVYVGFTLSHLVLLRRLPLDGITGQGLLAPQVLLLLAVVVSVWANDSFAYIVGSTLGRHHMAPHISPNKSWEGFAAGTVFTVAVWLLTYYLVRERVPAWPLTLGWHAAIGVAVSVATVTGDLFESRLKREAGVKDSGRLLPGHGGFLDRHDSLILVSVVAYWMIFWAGAR